MAEDKIVTKKTAAKKAVSKKTVTKKAAAVESDATAPAKTTADPVAKKTSAKPNGKKASAAPTPAPTLAPAPAPAPASQAPAASSKAAPKVPAEPPRAGRLHKLANVSPEKRTKMIEEAAYYRAEKRNFAPGHEAADWAAAEKEIDELIGRARQMTGH